MKFFILSLQAVRQSIWIVLKSYSKQRRKLLFCLSCNQKREILSDHIPSEKSEQIHLEQEYPIYWDCEVQASLLFSREFLENCEIYLRRNLVSPNPKSCCFRYPKMVNLTKERIGHLRFSWQSGTLRGQSYYKWIVISLLNSMVRFLHPSSCFSFSFPSDFSLDIQTISDTHMSWKLKVYSYWRVKKKNIDTYFWGISFDVVVPHASATLC